MSTVSAPFRTLIWWAPASCVRYYCIFSQPTIRDLRAWAAVDNLPVIRFTFFALFFLHFVRFLFASSLHFTRLATGKSGKHMVAMQYLIRIGAPIFSWCNFLRFDNFALQMTQRAQNSLSRSILIWKRLNECMRDKQREGHITFARTTHTQHSRRVYGVVAKMISINLARTHAKKWWELIRNGARRNKFSLGYFVYTRPMRTNG